MMPLILRNTNLDKPLITTTMFSWQPRFPAELVLLILYYCDPLDIIRWRTVSKGFLAITYETALWKTLYKDVHFSRPPGPYPTQSRTSIERTLCKAAQLAKSWTTRPMRACPSIMIETPQRYARPRVICGRWLIVCESQRRFILHDVDPVAKTYVQQVLCEQETDVNDWNVESIVTAEGYCVLYVILMFSNRSPEWKVLEFRLNYDTGEPCHSATIDPPQLESRLPRVFLLAGNSKYLFIPAEPEQLVFDTWTHVFYTVPRSYELPWECNCMLFSDSYFISVSLFDQDVTDIDIFMLPADGAGGESGRHALCHTHRGTIGEAVMGPKCLKPTFDPVTGATNIRILDCNISREDLLLVYLDLTIPRSSPGEVLQLDLKTDFISLPRERAWLSRYEKRYRFIDVSEDGHIRGFLRGQKRRRKPRPQDAVTNLHVMKFDIDTTREPWSATYSRIGLAEWSNEKEPNPGGHIEFDGIRGRLFYPHPVMRNKLIIADIE